MLNLSNFSKNKVFFGSKLYWTSYYHKKKKFSIKELESRDYEYIQIKFLFVKKFCFLYNNFCFNTFNYKIDPTKINY